MPQQNQRPVLHLISNRMADMGYWSLQARNYPPQGDGLVFGKGSMPVHGTPAALAFVEPAADGQNPLSGGRIWFERWQGRRYALEEIVPIDRFVAMPRRPMIGTARRLARAFGR